MISNVSLHPDKGDFIVVRRLEHKGTQWTEIKVGDFTLNVFGVLDIHVEDPLHRTAVADMSEAA